MCLCTSNSLSVFVSGRCLEDRYLSFLFPCSAKHAAPRTCTGWQLAPASLLPKSRVLFVFFFFGGGVYFEARDPYLFRGFESKPGNATISGVRFLTSAAHDLGLQHISWNFGFHGCGSRKVPKMRPKPFVETWHSKRNPTWNPKWDAGT